MMPTLKHAATALFLLTLLALSALAGDRAEQVARVAEPRAATFTASGKILKLEAHNELYTTVVRDKKDVAGLALLQKDGKEPDELVVTDAGKVHIGQRSSLKSAAELKKLAAAGKLPPLYPAYKHGENIVLLDGTLVVKLKDAGRAGAFADFCKSNKLSFTPSTEDKGAYAVACADDSTYADPFSASADLLRLNYVASAEPVFIILTRVEEDDKPAAPEKPAPGKPATPGKSSR